MEPFEPALNGAGVRRPTRIAGAPHQTPQPPGAARASRTPAKTQCGRELGARMRSGTIDAAAETRLIFTEERDPASRLQSVCTSSPRRRRGQPPGSSRRAAPPRCSLDYMWYEPSGGRQQTQTRAHTRRPAGATTGVACAGSSLVLTTTDPHTTAHSPTSRG